MRERNSSLSNTLPPQRRVFTKLHIGLDDIDATIGGCTTHLAYLLVKDLISQFKEDVRLIDYPNLVRLNPAIPYKTRGNGAVALRLEVRDSLTSRVKEVVEDAVIRYEEGLEFRPTTEPGLVFLNGDIPEGLRRLYYKALTDYVHIDFLSKIIEKSAVSIETPMGLKRGVIGALAAIGWPEGVDCTYELLAYRKSVSSCEPRCVDPASVKAMDISTREHTFMNYDFEEGRELITPHGPDPVLLGVRGESPEALANAFSMLKICEEVSGYMIFRTNQGTDAHHVERCLGDIRAYQTGCVEGSISGRPKVLRGGAVLVPLRDASGSAYVVAYRESGLAGLLRSLIEGDLIRVCGVAHLWDDVGTVLNAEKVEVKSLVKYKLLNPRCPKCGARMKSAGKGKGWKCPKCGFRGFNLPHERVPIRREISEGLYLPPIRAFKHLMKPGRRYGREKSCNYRRPTGPWIL